MSRSFPAAVGRFEDAIRAQRDAVVLFRETGNRPGEALALTNLGLALHEVGQFEDAIRAHQDAVVLFWEISDRQSEQVALGNLEIARTALRG